MASNQASSAGAEQQSAITAADPVLAALFDKADAVELLSRHFHAGHRSPVDLSEADVARRSDMLAKAAGALIMEVETYPVTTITDLAAKLEWLAAHADFGETDAEPSILADVRRIVGRAGA